MSAPHRDIPNVIWPGGLSLNGPHAVGSFALCPQLHGFAHEMHLRAVVESEATAVGTLVHAGLAYRYAAALNPRPDWYVYADGYDAIKRLAKNPDFADLALRVFAGYEEHWARVGDPWQPVLVEHQFVVQFPSGLYSARTDLLALEYGEFVLIDHKTCRKLSDSIRGQYAADRQMLTGLAIARASGYDVKRVVINALTKERPFPNFARYEIPLNHVAFSTLGRDTEYYIRQQAAVRAEFPDPMNRPRNWDACVRKYGVCDYFGLCTGASGAEHEFHVPAEYLASRQKAGT